jgi:hypothetical protein
VTVTHSLYAMIAIAELRRNEIITETPLDQMHTAFVCAAALAFGSAVTPTSRASARATVRMATIAPPAAALPVAAAIDMAACPETAWGRPLDIVDAQRRARDGARGDFAREIFATEAVGAGAGDLLAELDYFVAHAAELRAAMLSSGAVVLRGFELTKTPEGFQAMYSALGLKPCLDPLHSVAARPMVSKGSAVYEAVNKESRKNFFIGMHNEFVGKRAPKSAAFVCFKPAEEGGEFLLGDGRKILADLDTALVRRLYERKIRYSVMELPFFGWIDSLPRPVQPAVMAVVKGVVTAAMNAKVDFDVELVWQDAGYDGVRMLQARAPVQPPVVEHPTTGEPTWFCNVHSHSSALRKQRESLYGAERFESGASQINKSDMYYGARSERSASAQRPPRSRPPRPRARHRAGRARVWASPCDRPSLSLLAPSAPRVGDGEELSASELATLDAVTMANVRFVKMAQGDVVLLDNYVTLHGRNVFEGTRKHAVTWFE